MKSFDHLENVFQTDVGRQRQNNEDALLSVPRHGVFCVADGMGGADEGEVASQATVEAVERAFSDVSADDPLSIDSKARLIDQAMGRAAQWIHARARKRGSQGSGSTFVSILFDAAMPDRAIALHAGDSRAYLFGKRGLACLTSDHSLAALGGVSSEAKLAPMFRGVITRAVGTTETVDLERTEFDVTEGDLLVLCSDGLSGMVPDGKMQKLLKGMKGVPLTDITAALVSAANEAGGKDNVTVNCVRVGSLPPPAAVVGLGDMDADRDTSGAATGDRDTATATDELTGRTPASGMDLPECGDVLEADTPPGAELPEPRRPSRSTVEAKKPLNRRKTDLIRWIDPRRSPGRYVIGIVLALVAGALVLPKGAEDADGPAAGQLRLGAVPAGATVSIRAQGQTDWDPLVAGLHKLRAGTYEVQWKRPDHKAQRSEVVVERGPAELPVPDKWSPSPALHRLGELEQWVATENWSRLDTFFERDEVLGILEDPLNRRRWRAVRVAWQNEVERRKTAAINVALPVATSEETGVTDDTAPAEEPVAVQPPAPPESAAPTRLKPVVLTLAGRPGAGKAPVETQYREREQDEWRPLNRGDSVPLKGRKVFVRFAREGFSALEKTLSKNEAEDGVAARLPAEEQWQPVSGLTALRAAEAAARNEQWPRAAELLAAPEFTWSPAWSGYKKRISALRLALARRDKQRQKAERERLARAREEIKALIERARANGSWATVDAYIADIGAAPGEVFDDDDLREVAAWREFREAVRESGPGPARAAYQEQVTALLSAVPGSAASSAAGSTTDTDGADDPEAALCADVHAWNQVALRPLVDYLVEFLRQSELFTEDAGRAALARYWKHAIAEAVGERVAPEIQALELAEARSVLQRASARLGSLADGPLTVPELTDLAGHAHLKDAVTRCTALWLEVLASSKNIPYGEQAIQARLAVRAEALGGDRVARIEQEAAAATRLWREHVKDRPAGDDLAQWLHSGGVARLADLVRKVDTAQRLLSGENGR